METNNFSEQESLEVIRQMINTARNSLQKGIADFMIFWGYLIAATAIAVYILMHTLNSSGYAHLAWLSCIVGWGYSIIKGRELHRNTTFRSYTNVIFGRIWMGFGIACALLPLSYFYVVYRFNVPIIWISITPTILLMQGVCLFASSSIYKFKPFMYAAMACGVLFLCCYIFPWHQFLFLALCQILALVIPGHLLNKKAASDV